MTPSSLIQLYDNYSVPLTDFIENLKVTLSENNSINKETDSWYLLNRLNEQIRNFQPDSTSVNFLTRMNPGNKRVMVLTNGLTDDAVELLPVLNKMIADSPGFAIRCGQPDLFPDVYGEFFPNGKHDDPKLVLFNDRDGSLQAKWGPRPEPLQKMVNAFLINPDGKNEDMIKALRYWYRLDDGKKFEEALIGFLKNNFR